MKGSPASIPGIRVFGYPWPRRIAALGDLGGVGVFWQPTGLVASVVNIWWTRICPVPRLRIRPAGGVSVNRSGRVTLEEASGQPPNAISELVALIRS